MKLFDTHMSDDLKLCKIDENERIEGQYRLIE
jgi:hypothetical protein